MGMLTNLQANIRLSKRWYTFEPSLKFVSKVGAYPSGAIYSVHFKSNLLSLTTNIRLGIRGDKPLQSSLISESEVEAYPSGALYSVHFKSKLLS